MPNPETMAAAKEKLVALFRARIKAGDDSPAKQTELLKRSGINADYLSKCLNALAQEGVLANPRRGEWQFTEKYLKEQQL